MGGGSRTNSVIMIGTPNKGSSIFYTETSRWSLRHVIKKLQRSPLAQWLIPTYSALYDAIGGEIAPPISNNFPDVPPIGDVTYYSIYNTALDTHSGLVVELYHGWFEVVDTQYYQTGGDGVVPWESSAMDGAINKPLEIPTMHKFLTKDPVVLDAIIECLGN